MRELAGTKRPSGSLEPNTEGRTCKLGTEAKPTQPADDSAGIVVCIDDLPVSGISKTDGRCKHSVYSTRRIERQSTFCVSCRRKRGQSQLDNHYKDTCFGMNVENFKEEFSKFLLRFSAPSNDQDNVSIVAPLSSQEILEAVQDVLGSKFDVTLVDPTRDDVRTPASGIIVTTPDAPDIPKINVERNLDVPERLQSLDSLLTESQNTNSSKDHLSLPDLDQLTPKIEANNNDFAFAVPDARFDEKMVISKSSPAVCTLVRSDTFVREDEFKSVENGDVFEEKKIESIATNASGSEQFLAGNDMIDFFKKIKILVSTATDVINKIEDMQKDAPDNIRSIRRMSAMGCFPGLGRTSKMTRRSLSAFPGTPTSSRLSLGPSEIKDSAPVRSKSTLTISTTNSGGSKLPIPSTYRSVSSGALNLPKSLSLAQGSQSSSGKTQKTLGLRSPALSLVVHSDKSVNRPATIPKCPRVQSSAGKSGILLGKRKAT